MKTWKVLAVLMLLCAAVLAACTVAPVPMPADDSMAMEDEGPSGPVTLKFLALADDDQLNAWREILAEFQQLNDGEYSYVELEFETIPFRELFPKIESSVAVGLPWDLFQADGPDMKHYGFNRVIWPLTDHFSEEEMAQWFPQSIEEGSFRDQFLGPPIMQSCSLLMYNKDFTDAAGISPPVGIENAWTMEEAVAAWQDTTVDENGDGVPEVWGLRWGQGTWTGDYEHGIFRRSNGEIGSATYAGMGEDGVTFQGYLDTAEAAEAMQFYQDLHQTYKVSPVEAIPEIFESRQAAFMVTPDNRIGALNRIHGEGNFNWGVSGIPYFKTPVCHTGSWHYGISPNTQHFEEALEFVRYAASDAGARIWYKHVRPAARQHRPVQRTGRIQRGRQPADLAGCDEQLRHPAHPDARLHRVPAALCGGRRQHRRRRRSPGTAQRGRPSPGRPGPQVHGVEQLNRPEFVAS